MAAVEHIGIGKESPVYAEGSATSYWPVLALTPEISARMDLLVEEYPDGNYPSPFAEHGIGECDECDALRLLRDD